MYYFLYLCLFIFSASYSFGMNKRGEEIDLLEIFKTATTLQHRKNDTRPSTQEKTRTVITEIDAEITALKNEIIRDTPKITNVPTDINGYFAALSKRNLMTLTSLEKKEIINKFLSFRACGKLTTLQRQTMLSFLRSIQSSQTIRAIFRNDLKEALHKNTPSSQQPPIPTAAHSQPPLDNRLIELKKFIDDTPTFDALQKRIDAQRNANDLFTREERPFLKNIEDTEDDESGENTPRKSENRDRKDSIIPFLALQSPQ